MVEVIDPFTHVASIAIVIGLAVVLAVVIYRSLFLAGDSAKCTERFSKTRNDRQVVAHKEPDPAEVDTTPYPDDVESVIF